MHHGCCIKWCEPQLVACSCDEQVLGEAKVGVNRTGRERLQSQTSEQARLFGLCGTLRSECAIRGSLRSLHWRGRPSLDQRHTNDPSTPLHGVYPAVRPAGWFTSRPFIGWPLVLSIRHVGRPARCREAKPQAPCGQGRRQVCPEGRFIDPASVFRSASRAGRVAEGCCRTSRMH